MLIQCTSAKKGKRNTWCKLNKKQKASDWFSVLKKANK